MFSIRIEMNKQIKSSFQYLSTDILAFYYIFLTLNLNERSFLYQLHTDSFNFLQKPPLSGTHNAARL